MPRNTGHTRPSQCDRNREHGYTRNWVMSRWLNIVYSSFLTNNPTSRHYIIWTAHNIVKKKLNKTNKLMCFNTLNTALIHITQNAHCLVSPCTTGRTGCLCGCRLSLSKVAVLGDMICRKTVHEDSPYLTENTSPSTQTNQLILYW